jgi:RecJ-like exonuclease
MARIGILTHGDVDGVCSAALAKIACPGAQIEFAEPYELASKLGALPNWKRAFVLDLGISLARKDEARNAFKEASKTCRIAYIDHHSLPEGINRRTLCCETFVHKTEVSASELALEFFNPPSSLSYIALLGAIGDYQEHTGKMKELMKKYGWRKSYFETFLLEHALEASRLDHRFKRRVIQGLSKGLWPSDIPKLIERARSGIRLERKIENYVKQKARKIAKKAVLVPDVPFRATGKAAIYAIKIVGAEVGIGTFQLDDYIRFSMRRNEKSDLNLNALVQELVSRVGGNGGGHDAAVGGLVPIQNFEIFLRELRRQLLKLSV